MPSSLHRARLRYYANRGSDCHLCGLPIPEWLINRNHPLVKTLDHIIPRSLGGLGRAFNKKPAHACCNHWRGIRDLSEELTRECRARAVAEFARLSIPAGSRWRPVRRMVRKYLKQD